MSSAVGTGRVTRLHRTPCVHCTELQFGWEGELEQLDAEGAELLQDSFAADPTWAAKVTHMGMAHWHPQMRANYFRG